VVVEGVEVRVLFIHYIHMQWSFGARVCVWLDGEGGGREEGGVLARTHPSYLCTWGILETSS
jgi:hypothetical protein